VPPVDGYATPAGLLDDLALLRRGLIAVGAGRIARTDVDPIVYLVRTFGFHLAAVDVRQNSAFHDRALGQLLTVAGVEDGATYPEWDEARRRETLEAELTTRRPFANFDEVEGKEATAVMEVYRVIVEHGQKYGYSGLGALIVSMTRNLEDLLAVYVLARDAGLLIDGPDGRGCPLEVVPLFETIDDLERAPDVLDAYLSHPIVKVSLERRRVAQGLEQPVQQVMIGYSDSSKDGGIVTSLWSLHRGQRRLAEAGRKHGVRVRFFHGRGGTIGRGAGPTHRFVKALPPHTVGGDLRLTEQGETIDEKYANLVTAAHHLELLAAGTMYATAHDQADRTDPPELVAIMDELSRDSRAAYRQLLETDGFIPFFEQATPLDAIEASRIGSRPARRTGKRTINDLRAIPWVFAWNQSRFILPGWYGLGSALLGLRDRDPTAFERVVVAKREETRWAPLHYLISNAATAHMTSDTDIMARYAGLVEDDGVRDRLLGMITAERDRTAEALEAIYGGPLPNRRSRIHRMLQLRNEALVPLHDHQIDLLKRWRAARANGGDAEAVLPQLLLTVNAIASGLGATG